MILTPFQKYEIYVDAQTDEVSGFNTEPRLIVDDELFESVADALRYLAA